jgi:hypothetical protein
VLFAPKKPLSIEQKFMKIYYQICDPSPSSKVLQNMEFLFVFPKHPVLHVMEFGESESTIGAA